MDVGIGLPNSVPGASGAQVLEWARQAENAGFSSLATIGAVEYPSYEELTALAATGVVTESIGPLTNVLVSPARSAAELAEQATSVDQLTGGRLTLALGVGWRATDYELTGRDFGTRGRRFDEQLGELRTALRGEPVTHDTKPPSPRPYRDGGVPLLVGGNSDATPRRVAEFGIGWTAGGLPRTSLASSRGASGRPGTMPDARARPVWWRWCTSASGTSRRPHEATSSTTTGVWGWRRRP
jgi:alkanesulfonate monooxygenase SsuD/methylene tetrahydromethanopterin reductase-like flavin-dependent oxidoreductase (luciferase family)